MSKAPRRLVNFRAEAQTIWDIEDLSRRWACDKTEAVVRALRTCARGEQPADWTQGRNTIERAQMLVASHAEPPPASPAPFNPRCLHCGENFGAWNRNASLCPDCKESRHAGEPRSCPVCTAGQAI